MKHILQKSHSVDEPFQITDSSGQLQYSPFPICNETGKPLTLFYGVEAPINCTLDFISDPFFHLLEFYVHNDAPLTCRIPTRPLPSSSSDNSYSVDTKTTQSGAMGSQSTLYTPLVIALTGTLQLSHLHISNHLNLLLHTAVAETAVKGTTKGHTITSAAAYSINPQKLSTRIVIGSSLPLRFNVRWYTSSALPAGFTGYGGHVYRSTILYCVLSACAGAAVMWAWFKGFVLPRRLKTYVVRQKISGYGLPYAGYGGIGSGLSNGFGNGSAGSGYGYGYGGYGYGPGKKD